MKKLYQLIIASSFITTTCLMSGCATLTNQQKEAVNSLGKASADIGNIADRELNYIRSTAIDMQTINLALNPRIIDANNIRIDHNVDYQTINVRIKAAQALTRYGTLLAAFVANDQNQALEQAANNFANSLKVFDQQQQLSQTQLGALAKLIQFLGNLKLEADKAATLKSIVAQSKESLDTLTNLLIKDFTLEQQGMRDVLQSNIKRLDDSVATQLAKPNLNFSDRLVIANGFKLVQLSKDHDNNITEQIKVALSNFQEANQQLHQALEDNKLSIEKIKHFVKQVNQVRSIVKTLTAP